MAWDPEQYRKFQAERFAPFEDCLALVERRPRLRVIDLGCGTGELTRRLHEALPGSEVEGIDSSAEMLERAAPLAGPGLRFEQRSIEALEGTWDLVFSHAALQWVAKNAGELGIDPERIGVGGESAGGGLTAGTVLMARDRGGPELCFQLLGIPELDDRLDTESMRDYVDTPLWNRPNAIYSWTAYLGTEPGGDDVSPYAAPARATDLSGLPPAFVTTCQYDPLRDEGIEYARRLAHAGVPTELRHYPATFHGSSLVEAAAISRRMFDDEVEALRRGLRV